jgi:hypothetical protein
MCASDGQDYIVSDQRPLRGRVPDQSLNLGNRIYDLCHTDSDEDFRRGVGLIS